MTNDGLVTGRHVEAERQTLDKGRLAGAERTLEQEAIAHLGGAAERRPERAHPPGVGTSRAADTSARTDRGRRLGEARCGPRPSEVTARLRALASRGNAASSPGWAREWLVTTSLKTITFGTSTWTLSGVRSIVVRTPMFSTTPCCSLTGSVSPTRNGRSSSR